MNELMLIPNPDLRSEAMVRAGELRGEGYDASEALSEAWAEVRGEDNPIWDNPFGEPDDEDEEMELEAPKRRRKSNPVEASNIGMIALVAGAGYVFWCWYSSVKKGLPWNWTPWKSIGRPYMTPMGLPVHRVSPASFGHNPGTHTDLIIPEVKGIVPISPAHGLFGEFESIQLIVP